MHPAASCFEHRERILDILGLEIAAERIHEQHDFPAVRRPDRCIGLAEWPAPARQAAPGAEARDAFRQPGQPRNLGHITPPASERQEPLLLHISTAPWNPPPAPG